MNQRTPRVPWTVMLLLAGLAGFLAPDGARADDPPAAPADTAQTTPVPRVGVIQGNRVNLRVGPRPGGRPVAQLDDGAALLVVEELPGWLCVRVPSGVLATVAATYVEPVGADAVRVTARRLNLRVAPIEEGRPAPAAFRDRVTRGTVLPVVQREGDWVWVMVPEETRVYVSAKYVRILGPLAEHRAIVESARQQRKAQLDTLAAQRRERAARLSGATLRKQIGAAQQALYRFRVERGIARTPVVEVITTLERAIEAGRESPVAVRKLALAVRADLEAELELRMARKDAEVARLRGLDPPAEKPVAATRSEVEARGEIRWESAPGWRNGGEWVLWHGEEPRYVLQLTTGLPAPLPDLKAHAGGGVRTVQGRQPGRKVFGLPVLEVRRITK